MPVESVGADRVLIVPEDSRSRRHRDTWASLAVADMCNTSFHDFRFWLAHSHRFESGVPRLTVAWALCAMIQFNSRNWAFTKFTSDPSTAIPMRRHRVQVDPQTENCIFVSLHNENAILKSTMSVIRDESQLSVFFPLVAIVLKCRAWIAL